ncbi:hypothetical protein F7725_009099 [Dissostichus mawsoni]|uniref:Secreted protein n=1 Tax=Dissostichus mawsoni TaxID=36200 RepID=A0A7J5Z6K1_DISMA|nr:hypothetical protein F7725_009099 [Dissostichus mawsoni]
MHLLEELVGRVLVAVLLHLGQVALLGGDGRNSLYAVLTHRSAVSHLDDSVVDGGVLLLPQHHQGDDDHSCNDDASHHQADDGALVGANHKKAYEAKSGLHVALQHLRVISVCTLVLCVGLVEALRVDEANPPQVQRVLLGQQLGLTSPSSWSGIRASLPLLGIHHADVLIVFEAYPGGVLLQRRQVALQSQAAAVVEQSLHRAMCALFGLLEVGVFVFVRWRLQVVVHGVGGAGHGCGYSAVDKLSTAALLGVKEPAGQHGPARTDSVVVVVVVVVMATLVVGSSASSSNVSSTTVISLRSTPPDIGIISVLLGAVGVSLRLRRTAHKLDSSETVDTARQQHPVVVEIHGAVSTGLRTHRMRKIDQYLFLLVRYSNGMQVALTLVHALLVQELALVRHEQGIFIDDRTHPGSGRAPRCACDCDTACGPSCTSSGC